MVHWESFDAQSVQYFFQMPKSVFSFHLVYLSFAFLYVRPGRHVLWLIGPRDVLIVYEKRCCFNKTLTRNHKKVRQSSRHILEQGQVFDAFLFSKEALEELVRRRGRLLSRNHGLRQDKSRFFNHQINLTAWNWAQPANRDKARRMIMINHA